MDPLAPHELPEFVDRANEALRVDPGAGFGDFLEVVGVEHLRVARDEGGGLVAGAGWIPSAHRIAGAWVDAALVTAVWAAPAARGRGAASGLMADLLRELRESGVPLSSLRPATLALYRRVGYEVAAQTHHHRVRTADLLTAAPEGWRVEELAGVTPQHPGALAEVYAAALPALGTGATRRVHALWHALLRWNEGGRTSAVLVRDPGGEVRGSAALDTVHSDETVHVRELLALHPDAVPALLAHLAGYRGMFSTAEWPGSPADPFAARLREEPEAVTSEPLMLRILDVAEALEARRYPLGLRGEVALEIEDPVLPENAGPLTLELHGGDSGWTRRGGPPGRVRIHVRALAALYTSHATPRELVLTGLLAGPDDDLDFLAAAFAGPRPWLADRF